MIITNFSNKPSRSERNYKLYAAIAIVVVVVILGGYLLVSKVLVKSGNATISGVASSILPKGSFYWAVFLTNGQTYFGKLDPDDLNGNFIRLSSVYYLEKSATSATPGQTAVEGSTNVAPQTGGYSLIHLGNELHGPTDVMTINRDQVLFIEQLKETSKVVQLMTQPQ